MNTLANALVVRGEGQSEPEVRGLPESHFHPNLLKTIKREKRDTCKPRTWERIERGEIVGLFIFIIQYNTL